MSAVEHDDTVDELDSIQQVLDAQDKRREKDAQQAPAGFDPAALFLLKQMPLNLFDPTGQPAVYRCKGCGGSVRMHKRVDHFKRHRAAWLSGAVKSATKKETTVKQPGPKEQQLRERRENAAANETAAEATESVSLPVEEVEAAEPATPERAKRSAPQKSTAAKGGTRADSKAICAELVARLSKDLTGITTKENDEAGYVAIRSNGRLIGYGWLTNKADLRVEAAIEPSDIPDDDRVVRCNRSKDMAARTRVEGNASGYKLALTMLKAAAKKQAAKA